MKTLTLTAILFITATFTLTSCKKNQPSTKMEGTYKGHFEGYRLGNDTIVNSNYTVTVERLDKSTCKISGTLFTAFNVLVAKNGINVELVSPTDGLSQFLYKGEDQELSFSYAHNGDTAVYVGKK